MSERREILAAMTADAATDDAYKAVNGFVPRTVPEMLDAAKDGNEFGAVILGLFGALEKAMDDERPAR